MTMMRALPRLLGVSLAATLACSAMAPAQTTGTSHPEDLNDQITATDSLPTQHYAKPSPAVAQDSDHYVPPSASNSFAPSSQASAQAVTQSDGQYGPYVPYRPNGAGTPQLQVRTDAAGFTVNDDPTSGVVMSVPTGPNELPIGTRLPAELQTEISTRITPKGTLFTATLSKDVLHNGRVLIPSGSSIQGRITQIHGGRRIQGASAIRLQPELLMLPGGATYRLDAEVVDLDHFQDSRVNGEGTIVANGHGKRTAAALGLTTTSAVVAGAVLGGGVGAVVGLGIGGGVSAVWWLKQDRQQTLPAGTEIVFGLNTPLHLSPAAATNATELTAPVQ